MKRNQTTRARLPRAGIRGFPRVEFFVAVFAAVSPLTPQLHADQLSEESVIAAVETWVHFVTADPRPDASVVALTPRVVAGQVVGYIARLSGGGFCLCGADDLVAPVYLYSPHGDYEEQSSDCEYVLDEIAQRLQGLRGAVASQDPSLDPYREALSERAQYWQHLIVGVIPTPANLTSEVGSGVLKLDLNSRWNQVPPYNDQCPSLTSSLRCVTGCEATAMAQIMYYWKWPNTGSGSSSIAYGRRHRDDWDWQGLLAAPNLSQLPELFAGRLAWRPDQGGQLGITGWWDESMFAAAQSIPNATYAYVTALANLRNRMTTVSDVYSVDFSQTSYDWSLMGDVHQVPPDAGATEAARISYHAGVAAGMNYGVLTSGTTSLDVRDALRQHFRYDGDLRFDSVVDSAVLIAELDWQRPTILAGMNSAGGGHAWVVSGYNVNPNDDQFWVNLGWGGQDNDWYTLDSIPYGYTLSQDQLTRIAPAQGVKFVGSSVAGDGSPAQPFSTLRQAAQSAPAGARLIFQRGSDVSIGGSSLRLDRACTLEGVDVHIH